MQAVRTQTHSGRTASSRAYAGRTASFSPTAGTQCHPRLRRSLRKQTAIRLAFHSTEEALRKQANRFAKARKGKNPPHHIWKTAAEHTRRPNPGKTPGAGPSLFMGKMPSLLFCCFRSANQTHNICLRKHLRNRHCTVLHRTHGVFSRLRRALWKQTAIGLLCTPRRKSYEST